MILLHTCVCWHEGSVALFRCLGDSICVYASSVANCKDGWADILADIFFQSVHHTIGIEGFFRFCFFALYC